MSTRDLWLSAGAAALADEGPDAVRIDRLAVRVGLSKGSFHHHFSGIGGYRAALLERLEQMQVALLGAVSTELAALTPVDALRSLPARLDELVDADLDRALRAWAVGHREAGDTVERIDRARLEFLEALWRRVVADPSRAHAAALLPHLLLIGAGSVHPPLDSASRQALFDLLPDLLPHV
ncbi:TetR/AcrR family transcriptional regulator [Pseudonocardia abyssalis]|uniref:TetR/AcrR family transcriptional regulator n=1 Tax=Pseudonocardia abyssalis TaxID=2792008 RepID=A0ABS6UYV1_9PSEU|nr:TetR/AcrR family transcriptional regulator [Pseudonocardia abyssalis]MBW0115742.1 TetR/AcrR family transcriptional regulator [Pseudonocardia abyssalis]MBW0137415.1 TetR/AcrR family transcriptional regulator [Pseudonocardia abyssalis]